MSKVQGTARDENMPAYGKVHAPYSAPMELAVWVRSSKVFVSYISFSFINHVILVPTNQMLRKVSSISKSSYRWV